MSKKNNKQRSKKFHAELVNTEREITRRLEERRKKKILNKQANSLANDILNIGIVDKSNSNNCNDVDTDVVMKVKGYVKPKKAQRVRRRDRNYIFIEKRKSIKN